MPIDEKFMKDFKRIFEEMKDDARGTMEAPPIISGEQVDPQGAHLRAQMGMEALATSRAQDILYTDYICLIPRPRDGS